MQPDVVQISSATVVSLAPFLPLLIQAGKFTAEAIAEMVIQKGGENAWTKAQALWSKVNAGLRDDEDVKDAARMLARQPESKTRQTALVEVLAVRLQDDPVLASELASLLGGQESIQQVLADRNSWVEDIEQSMTGAGKQIVKASDDSVIRGVRQIKK